MLRVCSCDYGDMVPLLQTVQEGHQNSDQFHAILSGVLPTADPRSSTEQLTVSCSSAVFRDISCSKAAALRHSRCSESPILPTKPSKNITKLDNKHFRRDSG